MKTITVSKAKATLSDVLRRVARGETVLIVSRGRPVARIVPAASRDLGTDAERLARLERSGVVRRAALPPDLAVLDLPAPRLKASRGLLAALLEEREEGR
jgi:prevent-host-death family protein